MLRKRVLIISSHELFRQGLKRILAEETESVSVGDATSLEEAEELLQTRPFDAVILDQSDDAIDASQTVSYLLSFPDLRVITAKLDSGDLRIYRQQRVLEASVEDLMTALVD
jgi:DNA-binding NarL/FixJ family response regulator